MIKLHNVTKIYYPDTVVFQNIFLEIQEREFVSIVGKSGAGKTTLIKLILGVEPPTSGEIYFKDININKATFQELQNIRRRIGCIHQDYKLLSKKNVYENVAYILEVEGKSKKQIETETLKVLDMIGLKEKIHNFPEELSGGEKQRLAIARAFVNNPEVIIADEPTGNLDPYNTYEIIHLLKEMNNQGKTVILATHNREIINKLGKRVITIDNGKIIRDEKEGKFLI